MVQLVQVICTVYYQVTLRVKTKKARLLLNHLSFSSSFSKHARARHATFAESGASIARPIRGDARTTRVTDAGGYTDSTICAAPRRCRVMRPYAQGRHCRKPSDTAAPRRTCGLRSHREYDSCLFHVQLFTRSLRHVQPTRSYANSLFDCALTDEIHV